MIMQCYSWLGGWKIPADLHVWCGIASFPGGGEPDKFYLSVMLKVDAT